jgi:hypothetical protein
MLENAIAVSGDNSYNFYYVLAAGSYSRSYKETNFFVTRLIYSLLANASVIWIFSKVDFNWFIVYLALICRARADVDWRRSYPRCRSARRLYIYLRESYSELTQTVTYVRESSRNRPMCCSFSSITRLFAPALKLNSGWYCRRSFLIVCMGINSIAAICVWKTCRHEFNHKLSENNFLLWNNLSLLK